MRQSEQRGDGRACERVTITMKFEGRAIETSAASVAEARLRVAEVWPKLFPAQPQQEAAAIESILVLTMDNWT